MKTRSGEKIKMATLEELLGVPAGDPGIASAGSGGDGRS